MRSRLVWGSVAAALLAGAMAGSVALALRPEAHPPPPAAAAFGATDVAWIQLMIPMDEQALALLELVPTHTADRAAADAAARIAEGHRAELTELRALRDRGGVPTTNVHEGHDMPGMVSAAELADIGRYRGEKFVTRFTSALRDHLNQGVVLATGEGTAGTDRDTKSLAAAVKQRRGTELGLLTALPA